MNGHGAASRVACLAASLAAAACVAAACDGNASGRDEATRSAAVTAAATADKYREERRLCLELTNEYRAEAGRPPLTASTRLDAYAAEAARQDGLAHRPHDYFDRTDGGKVALAENLVPWWSLARRKSVRAIVIDGLAFMWAEGPTGPHARNIAGPYTQLGCGIFVNADEVTLVQAFR